MNTFIADKSLQKITYFVMTAVVTVAMVVMILGVFGLPGGVKMFSVESGSMAPTISYGSLIMVVPQSEYKTGDIITFSATTDDGKTSHVTHRVTSVSNGENGSLYETKGDANIVNDIARVSSSQIDGTTVLMLPLIGHFFRLIRTVPGFLVFIVVPGVMIVISEIYGLIKDLAAYKNNRKQKPVQFQFDRLSPDTHLLKKFR